MMPQGLFLCGRSQLLGSAGEGLMPRLQGFTPRSVQDLCVDEAITGYPSARIYRNGSDKLATPLGHRREQYIGDRTYEVLKDFVDDLVSSTGPAPAHTVCLALLWANACSFAYDGGAEDWAELLLGHDPAATPTGSAGRASFLL